MPATQTRPISINDRPFDGSVFRVLGLHADYVCGNSGHCCRRPWGINISDGEHRTMTRAMSESGLAADEIEKSFVSRKAKKGAGSHTFGQNSDGHCAFVGEDGCGNSTCTAQRRWGHEVLPAVCQSYPRLAVGTPAGVYLTLSYTCPTAAKLLLAEDGLRETAPGKVFKWYPKLQGISFGPGADPPTFVKGAHPDWATFDYFWRWASEWLARSEFTPAQGLYLLGQAVAHVEQHGRAVCRLPELVDLLDQVWALDPAALRAHCEALEPVTELGVVYLNILINVMEQTGEVPQVFEGAREVLAQGPESAERRQILDAYDRLVRPNLPRFERIERNFLASRLYANPLIYRSKTLRFGYFLSVLSLIELRFVALLISLREGVPFDELAWLRAAAEVDMILQHSTSAQEKFIKLLQDHAAETNLANLTRPALF